MLLLPAGKRKKWKCFAKFLYQVLKKKSSFIFLPPNLYPTKLFTGLPATIFYWDRCFCCSICFSLSEKEKERGGSSCFLHWREIKTEYYNHYLHHLKRAANIRDYFSFVILQSRACVELDSLLSLPFFYLHLLDQIWKWPDSVKKRKRKSLHLLCVNISCWICNAC